MKAFPVFSLACAITLAGCGKTPPAPPPPVTAGQKAEAGDVAHWLAEISAAIELQGSDARVAHAAALLAESAAIYEESEEALAAAGNRVSRLLRDMGMQASPVEVIEAAAAARVKNGATFQDIAGHYVALRKQGRSHDEARALMKAAPSGAG